MTLGSYRTPIRRMHHAVEMAEMIGAKCTGLILNSGRKTQCVSFLISLRLVPWAYLSKTSIAETPLSFCDV